MNKFFTLALMIFAAVMPAHAARVMVTQTEADLPQIKVENSGGEYAAFVTGNQLFLIFADKTPPALSVQNNMVTAQEILEVSNGSGVRLVWQELPKLSIQQQNNGFLLQPGSQQLQGQLSMVVLRDGVMFGGRDIGSLRTVTSNETVQSYQVMITLGGANWQRVTPLKKHVLQPTLAGLLLMPVGKETAGVNIIQEPRVVGITPSNRVVAIESPQTAPFTPTKLDAQTVAQAAEKIQQETGSRVEEEVDRTPVPWVDQEPSDYESAVEKLLNAISAIEKLPVPMPRNPREEAAPADGAFAQAGYGRGSFGKQEVEQPAALEDTEVFLPRLGATDMPPYLDQEERMLRRIVETKTEREKDIARLRFAQLLVIYQRPREALSVLENMVSNDEGVPLLESGRLFYAVVLALLERYEDAYPILSSDVAPDGHRQLWLAYVMQKLGKEPTLAVELFKDYIHHANPYPRHLWRKLKISQGWVLLEAERYDRLLERMEELALMEPDGQVPGEISLIMAYAKLAKEEYADAERLLAQAANAVEPEIAHRAQFDFVNFLYDRQELGVDQIINHLEDLRYVWRSTELERDVLLRLGDLYLDQRDYRSALERYKMLASYFPDTPDLQQLTNKMTRVFADVFDAYNENLFDDLGILGMYYDFRELTPPGDRGDKLVVGIGQRLQDMGLLERAIDLYSKQLRFRVKEPVLRAETGLKLAELYKLYFDIEPGLEVLKNTDSDSLPAELKKRRQAKIADLYATDERYDEALKALEGLDADEAVTVRSDIAWGQQDYRQLLQVMSPVFSQELPKEWTPKFREDFLRFTFGLHALGRVDILRDLKRLHAENITENDAMIYVDFFMQDLMASPEGVELNPDDKLSPVIENLMSYNKFAESYTQLREDRFRKKYQRARYNRRFRR